MNRINDGPRNLLSDDQEINRVVVGRLPLHLLLEVALGLIGYRDIILSEDEPICLIDTGSIKDLRGGCEDFGTLRKSEFLYAHEKLCLGCKTLDDFLGTRHRIPCFLPGPHLIVALTSCRIRIIEG